MILILYFVFPQICSGIEAKKDLVLLFSLSLSLSLSLSQGKITVKQSVINDVAPESKLLWRHKPCPFVYCYDKINGVDMCIDAR